MTLTLTRERCVTCGSDYVTDEQTDRWPHLQRYRLGRGGVHLDCTPPPDVEETDEDDDEPTALAARVARLTGWRLDIWCNPWMSEQQRREVLGI